MNLFHLMSCDEMQYVVLVSRTFQHKYQQLPNALQNQIKRSLIELKENPFTSRSKCDIKILKDTHPKKYRLRVGDYRIIYIIIKQEVRVIDLLKRELGYGRIE
jgi:mRNA-degrading endonuclease RelE of RelBE toxin-antitoxin system